MINQTIEATDEELPEFNTDGLSDEALDRDRGENRFGSGWTFTSCMS